MQEWLQFCYPIVDFVMEWSRALAFSLLVLSAILFGLYYKADDELDIVEVYVIPIAGTVIPALAGPLLICLLLLTFPIWVSVIGFCLFSWLVYKITKKYKENKR